MMKLQEIVLLSPEQKQDAELYYKVQGKIEHEEKEILLQPRNRISFCTYFNSFSIKKWREYTKNEDYKVCVKGKGKAKVFLVESYMEQEIVKTHYIFESIFDFGDGKVCSIEIPKEVKRGICYLELEATEEVFVLQEGWYEGQCEKRENVRIAIDICTFKREAYVQRNLRVLSEKLLKNTKSLCFGNVEVFISDNAGTLEQNTDSYAHVRIYKNNNAGGVGGFTRGILEAMKEKEKPFTHMLLLDDDAIIEPASIEKTYCLLVTLKEKYYNSLVGGSLLRQDMEKVQYELGAKWNRGRLVANKGQLDMSKLRNLLLNEEDEATEYTGWWYTCIPMENIRKEGLPLPLFIHRDDVEYGLRAGKKDFILMNGIGVWHEAFENKVPGVNEYYDWRNLVIVNSIHYSDYSKKELKKFLLKWVTANIIRCRYQYAKLNVKGVEDFLKGVDWLKEQDPVQLHQDLGKLNYSMKSIQEFQGYQGLQSKELEWKRVLENDCSRKNGILVATPMPSIYKLMTANKILYVDSTEKAFLAVRSFRETIKCYKSLWKLYKNIEKNFEWAKKEYRDRYKELTTVEFWNRYLDL